MAVQATLASSAYVNATDKQAIEDAIDAGTHKYAAIALRVDRISGTPTQGTVTVQIQHAIGRDNLGFVVVEDMDGTDLEFTVNYNDDAGTPYIKTTDRFSRYFRWACTGYSFSGGSGEGLNFSIELILK